MNQLLDRIKSPKDLKELKAKDLSKLAKEMRRLIIDTVSKTGGHLSSNLGVVELTLCAAGQDHLGCRPSVLSP